MKQYLTLSHTNLAVLDAAVNEALCEGWELYGSPYCVVGYNSRYIHFHQAMVMEDAEKQGGAEKEMEG
jgi:hypothetical protein